MIRLARVNPKPHPRFLVEKPGEKILEVLLAKITLWSQTSLNCLKIFSFSVTFSVAASTTKSQPTTPSLISV